jgi:HD-GYP domain-containing protein (c-di-GMP phosphodiesterase class II)
MLTAPDYTILDHRTAVCAVVDFNFRYVYVNKAAAKHEQMSREEMLGHTVLELHPNNETDLLFSQLKECLDTRRSVEYEDQTLKWRIKIEPVPEGAFIQWFRLPAHMTKIRSKIMVSPGIGRGTMQRLIEAPLADDSDFQDQSTDLEIEGWLDSLDVRTRETREHILRVAEATTALANMAGIPEREMVSIRRGALLHDIGKIGIPDRILLKPDKLTEDEWEVMRKHPSYAYDLFTPVDYLRSSLSIPYSHHEKWDGTGYPQGLKGEQIPLPARLFAVVDVWDTLSFDRVYRKAWPREKIMAYIKQQSGAQFDPAVVDLFFRGKKDLTSLALR